MWKRLWWWFEFDQNGHQHTFVRWVYYPASCILSNQMFIDSHCISTIAKCDTFEPEGGQIKGDCVHKSQLLGEYINLQTVWKRVIYL